MPNELVNLGHFRPPRKRKTGIYKKERMDLLAAEMRARNLSTGSGCKSTARAIEKRLADSRMR